MHAGGGFFGHAFNRRQTDGVPVWIGFQLGFNRVEQTNFFFRGRISHHGQILLGTATQMQQQSGIATIVQNHVGIAAVGPFKNAVGVIPVLFQRFAFDGKYGSARRRNRSSSVVLSRENITGCPTHIGTQVFQCFDQHGGLDSHMQRAGNTRAL